jgi:hypothetical protein
MEGLVFLRKVLLFLLRLFKIELPCCNIPFSVDFASLSNIVVNEGVYNQASKRIEARL